MNNSTYRTINAGTSSIGTSAAQINSNSIEVKREVTVLASSGNIGSVYIGSSSVSTSGTNEGFALKPDMGTSLNIDNINKIYAISQTADNRLHWLIT